MRVILSIVLVCHFNVLFCQTSFNGENLFRLEKNSVYRTDDFVSEAVLLEINTNMLVDIFRSDVENINFSMPISEKEIAEMTLNRFQVFTDDFTLRTSSGDTINDFKQPIFYRGRVKNFDGFATFCISENEVMGIISIKNRGDFNLGKMKDSRNSYIVYNDNLVKVNMGYDCHVDGHEELDRYNNRNNSDNIGLRTNCVKFYLEGDYALFIDKGSVANAANYMAGLFSQMATMYDNESINIEINEIKIWVSADGYSTSSSSTALGQFMDNNPNMNADLAHLFALGGNGTGGIAWVDVLCDAGYNFAYSNIHSAYNNVPTYSWSVEVITHETGHNLGSRHTHACVWNGNNTQIDDCGNKYYYDNGTPLVDIEGYPCYDPDNPILPGSGTVMSYCHLLSGIGINFNNGFGIQPGDLIRYKVNSAPCLTDCASSTTCFIPVNVETGTMNGTNVELIWEVGQGGSQWEIEYGLSGFIQGSGTIVSNITTTYYSITGLEIGNTYDWYIRTDCGTGSYSSWVGKKTFTLPCVEPALMQLPYYQGWENYDGMRLSDGTVMCTYDQIWIFDTDKPTQGRVRWGTQCPSDYIINGSGSLIMDKKNNYGDVAVNYAILELDLSNYADSHNLFFDFSFQDIGDENNSNDKVWVRGNESEGWIEAYDILPANKTNFQTYNISLDLDSLMNLDGQTPGTTFQIRFGQEDNASAQNSGGDGIVYDDIEIYDCGQLTVPYSTDFSDSKYWTVINSNSDAYTWALKTGSSCDTKYFGLEYNGSTNPSIAMDDWLFSPGFYMTAGSSYQVSFSVGDDSETEKMEIYLSTDNTVMDALSGTLIFKDESINNGTCELSSIEFTPPSTGYYFFGFHGYSNANSLHNLYIDDFSIDNGPGLPGLVVESNINNTCDLYTVNGVAGNIWHHIYTPSGKIVASVNPNDQVLGKVTIDIRDGGNVESYVINGTNAKTVPRYFNLNCEGTFSNPVSVRLYLLDAEMNEFNIADPVTNDVVSDLEINHYDGINEDCNFGNNSGTGTVIIPSDIISGTAGITDHYMQIDLSQFSEFLIHQAVNYNLAIKPEISGKSYDTYNEISVSISDYFNINSMVLQRRKNANDWSDIQYIDIKPGLINYLLIDQNIYPVSYYRVKVTDNEGFESFSNIISVNRNEKFRDITIFPNPANGVVYLQFESEINDVINVEIYNIIGFKVYSGCISTLRSDLKYELNIKDFNSGIYLMNFNYGSGIISKKLTVEK